MKPRAQRVGDKRSCDCNSLRFFELQQSEKIVKNSNVEHAVAVQLTRLRRFGRLHVFVFAVSPWRALPESFFFGGFQVKRVVASRRGHVFIGFAVYGAD
jgi:hypothetical protein